MPNLPLDLSSTRRKDPALGRVLDDISRRLGALSIFPILFPQVRGENDDAFSFSGDASWQELPWLSLPIELPLAARLLVLTVLDVETTISASGVLHGRLHVDGAPYLGKVDEPLLSFRGAPGAEYPTGVRATVSQSHVVDLPAGKHLLTVAVTLSAGATAVSIWLRSSTLTALAVRAS